MREFKFRVWDNGIKAYQQMAAMMNVHTGEISNLPDRFILEQFTGLIDKNGKAIYEGDIIKSKMYNRPYSKYQKWYDVIGEVLWDDGKMDGGFIRSEPGFRVNILKKPDAANGYYWSLLSKCEVIGTIHDAEYKELAK